MKSVYAADTTTSEQVSTDGVEDELAKQAAFHLPGVKIMARNMRKQVAPHLPARDKGGK